jgi:membrane-associated phospholipid phosphatase
VAVALLAGCVGVVAVLGVWLAHQTRASLLDWRVDGRLQAGLSGHQAILRSLARLGVPLSVTVMAAILVIACLATRRRRGAVLVAIAVPAAGVLTEVLLKPLVGRTADGALSFPSGHATGVFSIAVAFAVLLVNPARPRMSAALRLLLALLAFLAAGAVAVAVVALGLHYFTDTVAGAAVGTAVVLGTALIIDRLGSPRRWRQFLPGAAGQPAGRAEALRAPESSPTGTAG